MLLEMLHSLFDAVALASSKKEYAAPSQPIYSEGASFPLLSPTRDTFRTTGNLILPDCYTHPRRHDTCEQPDHARKTSGKCQPGAQKRSLQGVVGGDDGEK